MVQHVCSGDGCSACRDRVPLRSPVDVEAFVFIGEDGNEYMYARAVMERERENGLVTVTEDVVIREDTVIGHRRRCETAGGQTITRKRTFQQ